MTTPFLFFFRGSFAILPSPTKNLKIRHLNVPYVHEASHLSYITRQTKSQGLVEDAVFSYNMNNGS